MRKLLAAVFHLVVTFAPIQSSPPLSRWVMVAEFFFPATMVSIGSRCYFGHAGSDHGPWATKAVAYAGGVFVVPIGWGGPTSWLASEDGVNWRHLTSGQTKLKGIKHADGDPSVMPGTWGIAGGHGVDGHPVFVTGGYMTMAATSDLGKSITTFSLRSFKDDPRPRRLVTHHVGPVFCGKKSGRFLALGNDRSKENTVFGNLFASDDHGRTWDWLEPALLNKQCDGYCGIVSNGQLVLIADKTGAAAFVSSDAGESWEGPFATGTERASLESRGRRVLAHRCEAVSREH